MGIFCRKDECVYKACGSVIVQSAGKLEKCKVVIIFGISGNMGIIVTSFASFTGVWKFKSINSD